MFTNMDAHIGQYDRFTGKFLYLQIPVLLPVLPNSVTFKFYSCYRYRQIHSSKNVTRLLW